MLNVLHAEAKFSSFQSFLVIVVSTCFCKSLKYELKPKKKNIRNITLSLIVSPCTIFDDNFPYTKGTKKVLQYDTN